MVAQSPAFKQAIEDSRKLKAKPTNDELLEVRTLSLLIRQNRRERELIYLSDRSYTPSSRPATARIFPKRHSQALLISRFVQQSSHPRIPYLSCYMGNNGGCAFQGKYKYNAWKKCVQEENTSPQDAQKKYVDLIAKLKGIYGFEA